jgi:hypothetical protein
MRRFLTTLLLASLVLTALIFRSASGQGFDPPCESNLPLQLGTIAQQRPIDSTCDLDGSAGSESGRLQNLAKNNFCATGTPFRLTNNRFLQLQRTVEQRLDNAGIAWGTPFTLPPSRELLRNVRTFNGVSVGEGKVVRYVGFLINAHPSNEDDGETVNCSVGGKENNDIHMNLGINPGTAPCDTITAEISPHFRPDSWDEIVDYNIYHPVRITGQLFFDASHRPCRPGQPANPRRITSWEIHPVYAIDVCRNGTLTGCPHNDDSRWIPFHEWVNIPDSEDPPSD